MSSLIFCDESGDSSFSASSTSPFFSVCAITIPDTEGHKIKNTIKHKREKLYKQGWPKDLEIKANQLHTLCGNSRLPESLKKSVDGDAYIREILQSLIRAL